MFAHSKNVNISGGEFYAITYGAKTSETAQRGIELLQQKIAPGASHDSDERYDAPKCHAHTREAILQEIMDWIEDMDRQTKLLWLYGPAGAGKSAIEQTIAEWCYKMGFLAASFFFSRSVGGRNAKTFLITTIVDQLIVSIPEIRDHVGDALYNNPSLLTRSLEVQIKELVVEPLAAAASSPTSRIDFMNSRPKVIVIDGLDECGDPESQKYILKLLMNSVSNHSIPFSFIIASRPEQHIREAFNGKLLSSLTTRLVLDDKYRPNDDIRIFLRSKFHDIRDRHPSCAHLPPSWPSDEDVERLVQKSSGQFIYASTVIKFIDSHRHWPPDRLDIIFGLSPRGKTTPFAEMDSLYLHIFTSASENMETALEIFAILLFLQHQDIPSTPRWIESFLSLREGEVFMVLSDLHSIIAVPLVNERDLPLHLFHASLGDFLTDHSRCGDVFFLDSGVCHRNIVRRMVKKLCAKPVAVPLTLTAMIEEKSLRAVFPEQCLKATPDPEFLLNLYDFDMSLCPHPWPLSTRTLQIIMEPFNLPHRVPELLVWMQSQKHPDRKDDLFTHHLPSIDLWLQAELSNYPDTKITGLALTSVTLVDFPQFSDIYHLIPRFQLGRPTFTTGSNYPPNEDSEKWEIYVKYRHIISQFLTDRTRSLIAANQCVAPSDKRSLFIGEKDYVSFTKHLLRFLSEDLCHSIALEKYPVDIPKAVLIVLPIVFSKAGQAIGRERLLEAGLFRFDPWLSVRFPQENWKELFSSCYTACKLAQDQVHASSGVVRNGRRQKGKLRNEMQGPKSRQL